MSNAACMWMAPVLLALCSGCGSLVHHGHRLQVVRDPTNLEAPMYLVIMMERRLDAARGSAAPDGDALDDGLHALQQTMYHVSESTAAVPPYAQVKTLNEERQMGLHRLHDYKDDPPRRDLHFDLLEIRLKELRAALRRAIAVRQHPADP